MQFATLSDGLEVDVTGEFAIELEVPKVDICIEGRCVGSTGAFEEKVCTSFDGESIGMDLPNAGKVDVIASQDRNGRRAWKDCRRRFR